MIYFCLSFSLTGIFGAFTALRLITDPRFLKRSELVVLWLIFLSWIASTAYVAHHIATRVA